MAMLLQSTWPLVSPHLPLVFDDHMTPNKVVTGFEFVDRFTYGKENYRDKFMSKMIKISLRDKFLQMT